MRNTELSVERKSPLEIIRIYSVIFTAIVLIVVAVIMTRGTFLSLENLLNVGERAAAIGIVAIGQMLVILTGNIDLSVSGIMAVSLASSAALIKLETVPFPVVIILMLVVGIGCGALNGLVISRTKIPSFMFTLGTYLVYQSIGYVISKAQNMGFRPLQAWMNPNGTMDGRVFAIILWLALGILFIFILAFTRFGKNIYATGASKHAATMSGVKGNQIIFLAYTICGLMCAFSAWTMEYRLGQMNVNSTSSYQIESIGSVVVGGVSMNGGEGKAYGPLVGAFIMAALLNLLNLYGVGVYQQNIVKGLVLIGFVALSSFLTSSSQGAAKKKKVKAA
jgi:ribose/xylose/arabinose/galactoside ABC-type transport system permease subunit